MGGRPEELINRYVRILTATANMTRGVGALALLWSTVVLLGGLVSVLRIKEFSILTILSFLMASRVLENYDRELFKRGIYWEEAKIFAFIGRQKWIPEGSVRCQRIFLGMVLLPKSILLVCLALLSLKVTPYVSLGISVWRLVRRDYGNAGGDDVANTAKLNAALNIFYALVLFQSLLVMYRAALDAMLDSSALQVALLMRKQCGHEKWIPKLVDMYRSETTRKFRKDGKLPNNWNLIAYGIEMLQSAYGHDDHRWGARVLDKLFDQDKTIRQELLSSRVSIQNLMGMIGRRGAADDGIENRERGTRIIAHLATDLHITRFPGTLQCICSLLESSCACETQVYYDIAVPITAGQTDEEQAIVGSPSAALTNGKRTTFHGNMTARQLEREFEQEVMEFSETKYRHLYKSMGTKELISQGLLILERLTQDERNSTEISKDQRLLSIITAPLRSHDILSRLRDNTVVQVLSKALRVLSRLLTSPGDDATRLRQKLASNTQVVSNLMSILENDREGPQELHGQALDILTELAFDDSFKELDFNKFFKTLLRIFRAQLKQADDIEKATRLRGRAAEALARLIPLGTARRILSKRMAINVLTTALNEISSSKMGTIEDTPIGPGGNNSRALAITIVRSQPLTQENEKQSKERNFMSAMLSLAVVIYNEYVISEEDFANCATPVDDEALAKKLKEILEVNKKNTAECLRMGKLICQVVIAITKVKPSCIQIFNGYSFKKALAEALKTMSELDDCMLFAGNDREVIKPTRSLASLVKEAQELLQTA